MPKKKLQIILINLLKKNHLLSVSDILFLINKLDISFNKTSIYRALEKMVDNDLVCQHNFNKSQTLYELKNNHHAHMICKICGKIFKTKCDYHQPEMIDGFKINHHHLTLIGTCKKCIKLFTK